jgi:hypothetical protein
VLVTAAAGGVVYGGIELAKALEDKGVVGDWTFAFHSNQWGTSSGPITLSGDKNSGIINWGDGYTGNYSVGGSRITLGVNWRTLISQMGNEFTISINDTITGTIQDNNSMSGNYSFRVTISIPGIPIQSGTDRGSWSATRR